MRDAATSASAIKPAEARSLRPDLGDPRNGGVMSVISVLSPPVHSLAPQPPQPAERTAVLLQYMNYGRQSARNKT